MKRPAEAVNKWRLDLLLKERAEHGVKIFILLYKEVGMALTINSAYTKKILSMQHANNIQVSRVLFSEVCLQHYQTSITELFLRKQKRKTIHFEKKLYDKRLARY